MRPSKKDRIIIHQKYGGHCAYCGDKIELKAMQVDHIHPVYLGGLDDILNYHPACRTCNYLKATYTITAFKHELEQQVKRARRSSYNFRVAEKYGLLRVIDKQVIFYFERISRGNDE